MAIVVYGANPSGIAAAVEAARRGVPVWLIEPSEHFGGMWTGGLNQTDRELRPLSEIGWGIEAEMATRFGIYAGTGQNLFPTVANAVAVFRQMLAELSDKITLVMGAELRGVTRDANGRVTAVNCGGVTYVASNFVDATDAVDLAAGFGCMMRYGRDSQAMTGEPTAGVLAPVLMGAIACDPMTGERLTDIAPAPIEVPGQADHRIMSMNMRVIVTDHPSRLNWADVPIVVNPEDYRADLNIAINQKYDFIPMSIGRDLLPVVNGLIERDANNGGGVRIGTNWVGKWNDWRKLNWTQRAALRDAYARRTLGLLKVICTDSEWAAKLPALVADTKKWGLVPGLFPGSVAPGMSPLVYEREVRQIVGQDWITQSHAWAPKKNQVDEPVSVIGYLFDGHWVQKFAHASGVIAMEGNKLAPIDHEEAVWQVPFGCLKPMRSCASNLMVARGISGSRNGWQPARIELSYIKLGQVCGMAAAVADLKGVTTADLDYQTDLLPALRERGAYLTFPEAA